MHRARGSMRGHAWTNSPGQARQCPRGPPSHPFHIRGDCQPSTGSGTIHFWSGCMTCFEHDCRNISFQGPATNACCAVLCWVCIRIRSVVSHRLSSTSTCSSSYARLTGMRQPSLINRPVDHAAPRDCVWCPKFEQTQRRQLQLVSASYSA